MSDLRVLSVVKPPPGGLQEEADREWESLNQVLRIPLRERRMILDRLQPPTAEALYRRLRGGRYDVLHFAGHGAFGPAGETLQLEDERGRSRLSTGRELAEILGAGPPGLVFLNTAQAGSASAPLPATAESLVRKGVPSVVAVPREIMGAAAEPFSSELYQRLSSGEPVEAAMVSARNALAAAYRGAEWGIPAIYTSAPDQRVLATEAFGNPYRAGRDVTIRGRRSVALSGGIELQDDGGKSSGGGSLPPPSVPPEPPDSPPSPPAGSRFLQGRFPSRVKLGDPVSLLARIGLEPGTETNVPLKEVTVPPEGLDCVLILNAPGFEIQSGDRRKLRLPHAADSDWVYFDLKAVRAGVHRLVVTAFVEGGSYLGDLLLETTVDSGMRTGESRERRQFLRARRLTAGEVALRIWFDDEKKVYRFHLNDGSILPADDQESDRLIETPSGAVKELIDQIHQVARARVQFNSVQETRAWLQGKGIALWDLLIPGELKRRFWELAGEIQRIFIVSGRQGDPIPWELLYPIQQGTSNDLGFLAERFHISRWIGSDDLLAPSQDLQLAGAAFIDPVGSNLDSAREEIKKIRELLDGRGARTSEPISDLTTLRGLLDRGGFGLLHFACHNSYGAQTISMGAKPFQPSDLGIYQNRFATTSPLVFLNACRSDSKDASFTALSGWARAFLKTAVGAFVGTLWEVRDATASTFAEEFYRSLLGDGKQQKPRSLGEALQAARNAIRDVPGDPTWLAYTLYGDSTAMLAPGGTE